MKTLLQQISQEHGTPCYVYFLDDVRARVEALADHFGGRFDLSYAVKSNPNRSLLSWMRDHVHGLDISSGGELKQAIDAGWPTQRISFTGPGKRPAEIEEAVRRQVGELIVESLPEAMIANRIAQQQGVTQDILIRVAPKRIPRGFGVNMASKPSQFGIDEEEIGPGLEEILGLEHLKIVGFHIYSGTQCLKADSIAENYEIFIELFQRMCQSHDLKPSKLVFGAGIGIPYYENDEAADLSQVAARINPQLDALKADPKFANATLVLELGRYLVGEAGIYLTSVIAKKHSRGTTICICDGGMNHHLGACGHFGSVIHRNYRMFKVTDSPPDAPTEAFELVGPLCTTIDTLGHGVKMDGLDVGDVIAVHCSGAYGLSASPIHFISHDPPKEIIVETRGGEVVTEIVD